MKGYLNAPHPYHWQEMPQGSFMSPQKCCHDKHVFVATKHFFCHNKNMLITRKLLLWQNYVCHDKTFVATDICLNKHNFVATKVLSWQGYFCCNKRHVLLRQTHVCDKHVFVATNFLLWQKWYLWQLLPIHPTQKFGRHNLPWSFLWSLSFVPFSCLWLALSSSSVLTGPLLVLDSCPSHCLELRAETQNQQWWRFQMISKPKQNKQKSCMINSGVMDGCLPDFTLLLSKPSPWNWNV